MIGRRSMAIRRSQSFWLALAGLAIVLLWLLRDAIVPFVAAFALAYLLDPPVRWLQKLRMRRWLAALLALGATIAIGLLILLIALPPLAGEFASLLEGLPEYASRLQKLIDQTISHWADRFGGWERLGLKPPGGDPTKSPSDLIGQAVAWGVAFLRSLVSSSQAVIGLLSLLVVTPIVTFYLLVDWDRMIATVDSWLPRANRDQLRGIAREANAAVAASLRGQALVSLFLAVWYGAGLLLVGLNFGFLIGLSAGLLSVIPYVGSFVGLTVAALIAIVQFWPEWQPITLVLLVFATGQLLEGYVLAPKLIGEAIGLHPVWMMFSLFAFGALFGFAGLLLAVPLSATAAVLARHGLKAYLASPYYDRKPADAA